MPIPESTKLLLSSALSALPQCRYERIVLLLGHMRSGSTALANVLCSHASVSGYGETHVGHGRSISGGRIVLNQWRRASWRPGARYLFDKVLHNRYDDHPSEAFFRARIVMLARPPVPTIRSIRLLADTLGNTFWTDDARAADYYERRMTRLLELWRHFAPERRLGITHARLLASPETELARITTLLALDPPLRNHYSGRRSGHQPGGGDPLVAALHTRIMPEREASLLPAENLTVDVPPSRLAMLEALYAEYERAISAPPQPGFPPGLATSAATRLRIARAGYQAALVAGRGDVPLHT